MKFLKGFLKHTISLLIAWVLLLLMGFISFFILVSGLSRGERIEIKQGSFLVIDLSRNLPDKPPEMDLSGALRNALENEPTDRTYLREMLQAVERAAGDERIAGIFLEGSFEPRNLGSSYASIRELRRALQEFRESGKPIYGYMTNPNQRDLYFMSVADELFMNPFGTLDIKGLGAELMFYRGAFEKFGIGIQVARVGKYKSAVEPYTRKNLSEESREQLLTYLEGMWDEIISTIGEGRGVDPQRIRELSDSEGLLPAERVLREQLADDRFYKDEVIEFMIARGREDKKKHTFQQVDVLDYINEGSNVVNQSSEPGNKIAVVYAEGAIVPGKTTTGVIGSESLSGQLRELRRDDKVKAVVLRVNSPGGSAYASEIIQREMELIRKEKPLIVSQGSYAASGGYWISVSSDYIFAEPTTLTGSIGVFILLPNFEGAADWMGVTFENVSTGSLATLMTPTRPRNEAEMKIFQNHADSIYESFLERVAEGRNLDRERVDSLAQGKIWMGMDAVEENLVDAIGGLEEAIDYAVEKAEVGSNYTIVEYPAKKSLNNALAEMFGGEENHALLEDLQAPSEDSVLNQLLSPSRRELEKLRHWKDPLGIYARLPFDLNL